MGVFAVGGVEGTRVEDLIAAARVSRRTFYKYFGRKEDVLAALYEVMTGALVELIRTSGEPGVQQIHVGIDAYLDFHVVGARLLRVMLEQAMRSESPLYPRRRWLRAELILLLQGATRGSSRAREDPMLLWALLSMLEGLSFHLLETDAGEVEVAQAKRTLHGLVDQLL
jgi:AcrR family transcriptional regulator